MKSNNSFSIVAKNHIKFLRQKYLSENQKIKIKDLDWSQLSKIKLKDNSVLMHPFLHPFSSHESFIQTSRNFSKLLNVKNKIGGFDVADSDRISNIAVNLINKIDLIMVPSNFAKNVYIKSGVTIPVEVLPHGISDEFLNNSLIYTNNPEIRKLRKMKEEGKILILYFLSHSEYRKGADLVKEVMKRVQDKFKNAYLVVKSKDKDYFSGIRSICLESWMSDDDLKFLYDSCDICLCPSRGGGFELNALEAASRGIPTLVTNAGCFLDLIEYFIPINIRNKITRPLPGNKIHNGFGNEADLNDFEFKLEDVINRLEYWKNRFIIISNNVKQNHRWKNTADLLDKYLKYYEFY